MIQNNQIIPFGTIAFPIRLLIYLVVILIISNINPLVDLLQHPDIPYFDEEHLLVGVIAIGITVILLIILEIYLRSLNKAIRKIKVLESFVLICAYCKRIRLPETDPAMSESWIPLDRYIEQHTLTKFSHGMCIDCFTKKDNSF